MPPTAHTSEVRPIGPYRFGVGTLRAVEAERRIVGKIVRAAAKRVGINKPVSPHWLRHATATHLMDAGVSLVAIKEHLGHETIQTTTRYTHVKPSAANAKLLAW